MRKAWLFVFVFILVVSTFLWDGSTTAQTIPTPSVPKFTVKQINQSYDVAPYATTNPYTGEPTTNPGYHVQKLSIEITIKNEPFTPTIVNGNTTGLFYNVEAKANKPHFTSGADSYNQYAIRASSEKYTVITIQIGNGEGGTWEISSGTQVDIKVQAVIGYSNFVWSGSLLLPSDSEFTLLSASDWSSTQTITIGSDSDTVPEPTATQTTISPTENPTAPAQPAAESGGTFEVSWENLALVACGVVIAVLAVVLLSRRGGPKKERPVPQGSSQVKQAVGVTFKL